MNNKIWKRNAVVATVLLFVCAGIYLNWSYNQKGDAEELADVWNEELLQSVVPEGEDLTVTELTDEAVEAALDQLDARAAASAEEYFAQIRLSRQESRDSAINLLQETIAYETGADDAQATLASQQLEAVVNLALEEAQIESLVIAKGYQDCVCFMNDDTVSVAVSVPETGLSPAEVASIADIVVSESDYEMPDIRVIEVG